MTRHHSNYGHSSRSERPRTFAEAQQGFQEHGLTLPQLREGESSVLEWDVEMVPRWRVPWTGSTDDWIQLNDMMRREIGKMRNTASSTSGSSDEYWGHLDTSRRLAAPGMLERAGGYPSDMTPSYYASDTRSSDVESTPSWNIYPNPRNSGGNRDNGRTNRNEGGRHSGQSLTGPWGPESSGGVNDTRSRVQEWVHDTSSYHNTVNRRADSAEREVIINLSTRTGRPYADASTQTW